MNDPRGWRVRGGSGIVQGAHRWSGWPGAWCLDCGIEDPEEIAVGSGRSGDVVVPPCFEPGSRRHDPYTRPTTEEEG